jgi:hypothetical protein
LPPHSELGFTSTGEEKALRFRYGFLARAYSQNGNTYGATFTVELNRAGAGNPATILFQRESQPVLIETDQGSHQIALSLNAISPGDELIVSITPRENTAWDWTYVTDFVLN